MSTFRMAAAAAILIVASPVIMLGEPPETENQNRQRIRSVRVLEVKEAPSATADASAPVAAAPQTASKDSATERVVSYPMYGGSRGGYGYGYGGYYNGGLFPSYRVGRRDYNDAYHISRQTERYAQNVFELQQQAANRGLFIPLRPPVDGGGPGGYGDPLNSFYDYGGSLEYYRQQELYLREQMALATFQDFWSAGTQFFREGAYRQAARAFIAAADKNQEDAASRLMAGQALLASRAYDKSLAYFRRAVELQPLILNFPMNLQSEYGAGLRRDFDMHLDMLRRYCNEHRRNADGWLLLACTSYFGQAPEYAEPALRRARMLSPKDELVTRMWNAIVVADAK